MAGVRVLIDLVVTEKMGIPVLPAMGHRTHLPAFKWGTPQDHLRKSAL